ncbi:MAG: hypothetical protein KGJ13_09340 [Patescibacteria group bacterium]|nr:hypothetical protein [Patescibacteria group bacterium]
MSSKIIKSPYGRRKSEGFPGDKGFSIRLDLARQRRAIMERGEQLPNFFKGPQGWNYSKREYSEPEFGNGPKTES